MILDKAITFDRETRDYRMTLDGQFIGYAPTHSQAETILNATAYEWLTEGYAATAEQLDGGASDPPEGPSDIPDQHPNPTEGDPEDPGEWVRDSSFDKRFSRGDDYAGDAWRDRHGMLRWCAVGSNPNHL